ncbi:MAG: hypothetical protein R3D44_08565 [Hyphomicrobiaceae bacterium]
MSMHDAWPWLAVAGLGAFHGLHPASGWLFAAAFGLRGKRRAALYFSLIPIAVGHALSIVTVATTVALLGFVMDLRSIGWIAGGALIAWGIARALMGARQQECAAASGGMLGLMGWSFVMSTSHGTGLMLVPILLPLCLAGSPAKELFSAASVPIAMLAVGLHLLSLVVTTAVSAAAVYGLLSRGRLEARGAALQHIWTAALMMTGLALCSSVVL